MTLQPDSSALARFRSIHEQAFARAQQATVVEAARLARRRSGRLASSIQPMAGPQRSGLGVGGAIGSSLPYAALQERGGTIRPRARRALSWVMPSGARIVMGPGIRRRFARVDPRTGGTTIFVPGTEVRVSGHPYLRPASERFAGHMFDALRAVQ
ncbi:MAG TPA: hypothetical protein VM305_08415 [Candidatus Limnocylindrales bacterium]|nr:hypothetical protein [Candidatus Limnocylindrales bacterium]